MKTTTDASRQLTRISRDTMLIGAVLTILGGLLDLMLLSGARGGAWIAAGATLVLLAPGVWFVYAGWTMRNARDPIVKWSMCVAAGQLAACVIGLPITMYVHSGYGMAMTAFAFFVPAQLVLLFELWQARHLIRTLEAARGFLVASAVPPATDGGEPIAEAEIVAEAQLAPPPLPATYRGLHDH